MGFIAFGDIQNDSCQAPNRAPFQENVFKITIEGQSPLEMGTEQFLEISRLMKTYISIMVRRKQNR